MGREYLAKRRNKQNFGISISKNDNFIPGRGCKASLCQAFQEIPCKTVAGDVGIRNTLCLDCPTDFDFQLKHTLCRPHCMDVINIISELRWQKSLQNINQFIGLNIKLKCGIKTFAEDLSMFSSSRFLKPHDNHIPVSCSFLNHILYR